VKGKGNLPVITAPTVAWPTGVDAFDPTAKEDVNKTVVPMSGSKSFDYVFTARVSGNYTIPAVKFSYFDPSSQTYKTAGSEPLELRVTAGTKKKQHTATDAVSQTASSAGSRLGRFLLDHLEILLAILLFCGVILYFWRQKLRLKKKDGDKKEPGPVKRASVSAPATAPAPVQPRSGARDIAALTATTYLPVAPAADPLLEARQFFDAGDYKAFYREVNRAIWKSIDKKLEFPSSELNKQNVIRQLELRGWDAPSVLSLENILNECELNLYTPAYDTYNMQQLLRQAEWILVRLA
jgi:hypothetical protein